MATSISTALAGWGWHDELQARGILLQFLWVRARAVSILYEENNDGAVIRQ